ncbi:hypothetical protein BAE44_0000598 [Dichanthelium oligosanthes]|uniref:Uncharacterized protein n=1 Tax=Dichanthelium oligosanthes TaxID=888268 RepID=A0A1E5WM03_9POAL|nr:hypothetical protein BAE44_0000598 [Dichanthelium oligosanthes]
MSNLSEILSLIQMDADEILKMQPGNMMEEDIMGWAFDRAGTDTVKSAYKFLKGDQTTGVLNRNDGGASSQSG